MKEQTTETIALILYPGCILFELALALEFLSKNFKVEAYSPSGGLHSSSLGTMIPTRAFSEGPPASCRAVLVPGGDFGSIAECTELDLFLQKSSAKDCVIAAVCGGAFALAKAGVLKGRKFVHPFTPDQMALFHDYFAGSEPHPEKEFFHDGNLLTAQPYAHIDFAVELAARLGVIPADKIIFFKNYHRGLPRGKLRPLALALITRPNGQMLLHEGTDRVKGEKFYRPLGGGIEFGESSRTTIEREFMEEIGRAVTVGQEIGVVENIFTYEGRAGHEIVVIFEARFTSEKTYLEEKFLIDESGSAAGFAVWKSLEEIQSENAPLYPLQLSELIRKHRDTNL